MHRKANPFSLLETEGWQESSQDIISVIRTEINLVNQGKKDAADGWKEIRAVLRKYQPWGATDCEPRHLAASTFGRSTGTDPETWIWT